MKIIDLFFYMTYRFAHNRLKKDKDDAKWSALLHTSLYLGFFLITLFCLIGLIYDNDISSIIKGNPIMSIMAMIILSSVVLGFRYYFFIEISFIENRFNQLEECKKNTIKKIVILFMILIPIIFFFLFRLYVLGTW